MLQQKDYRESKYSYHMNRQGQQKHKEVSVVPAANAIIDPWAMMIKSL